MAIKFDVEENEKQQEQEIRLAKEENREGKIIKVKGEKNPFEIWSNVLLILSIVAVVYTISYVFSGFILLLPSILLWLVWIVVAILATILSLGTVWLSKGFKSFMKIFKNLNTKLSNGSIDFIDVIYKIFPFVASFFAVCVICLLILKIIGAKKHFGKSYKSKLVWAIILTVLFVGMTIFDIFAYVASF